jgi:hypothetical protein
MKFCDYYRQHRLRCNGLQQCTGCTKELDLRVFAAKCTKPHREEILKEGLENELERDV